MTFSLLRLPANTQSHSRLALHWSKPACGTELRRTTTAKTSPICTARAPDVPKLGFSGSLHHNLPSSLPLWLQWPALVRLNAEAPSRRSTPSPSAGYPVGAQSRDGLTLVREEFRACQLRNTHSEMAAETARVNVFRALSRNNNP